MVVNYKLLGKRVKKIRIDKGMSQAELAARSKTTAQYLSLIENGKKRASLQTLVEISDALNVTIDELLVGNQVHYAGGYNNELVHMMEECSVYEKRIIIELIAFTKKTLRENYDLLVKDLEKI